jgi:hypothetical protein
MATKKSSAKKKPAKQVTEAPKPALAAMKPKEQVVADLVGHFAALSGDFLAMHRSGEVAPEDQTVCYRHGVDATATVLMLDEAYTALVEGEPPTIESLKAVCVFSAEAMARAASARKLPSPKRLAAAWSASAVALDRCASLLDMAM